MRKHINFIFCVLILGLLIGCSASAESFDDKNIIFDVINTEESDQLTSKTIEITNETGFDLDNLSLIISYPLATENNNHSNRETILSIEGFGMKTNQSIEFLISLPVEKDFKSLEADFKGDRLGRHKKIPFGMGGTLRVFLIQ